LTRTAPDRPLRILHVSEAFGGGVLEMVATLSERLVRRGHRVAIAYGRRPETPADVRARIDPPVELLPLGWERRRIGAQLAAARRLRKAVAAWRPDVLHLHSSFAGLVGVLALAGRRVPIVYTPHGYSFTMGDQSSAHRLFFRAIERLTARQVTLVGAVSESEAATARAVAPADKVVVVRNGVPELDGLEPEAPLPKRHGRPTVIVMGRITAQHLPEESARLLASVADIATIQWVGGGGRGDVPPSVVSNLGVPVTGWVERSVALDRLRAATALLHWTGWDGQPLSVLEALAADVVVVGHDIDAVREILGPEQVRADEAGGRELLRRVLTDSRLRERLLRSQRQRRVAYGAEKMTDGWLAVYAKLTESLRPLMHLTENADVA
jgi:glycosyltransferase involved in cell wall biosynthesis